MTYQCGIGPGMKALGLTPGPPHFRCDDCGTTFEIKRNPPPAWFLAGKAPRGWVLECSEGPKKHYCGRCKVRHRHPRPPGCECDVSLSIKKRCTKTSIKCEGRRKFLEKEGELK